MLPLCLVPELGSVPTPGGFWVSDVAPWVPRTSHLAQGSTKGKPGKFSSHSAAKYLKTLLFLSASNYLCSPSRVSSHCSVLITQTERCRALPRRHRPPSLCGESLLHITDHVQLDVSSSQEKLITLRCHQTPLHLHCHTAVPKFLFTEMPLQDTTQP